MPAGPQQEGNHNGPYILNVVLVRHTKVHYYAHTPISDVSCNLTNVPTRITVSTLGTNKK